MNYRLVKIIIALYLEFAIFSHNLIILCLGDMAPLYSFFPSFNIDLKEVLCYLVTNVYNRDHIFGVGHVQKSLYSILYSFSFLI